MRRILITVVASVAVLAAAPATTLARTHHHRSHHARRHHRHHARHRVVHRRFSSDPGGSSSGQAGTVTSFTNGILTITLNDGSMVSGAVTGDTNLECMSQTAANQGDNDNDDNGANNDNDNDDNSANNGDDNGDGSNSGGDAQDTSSSRHDGGGDNQGDNGDDDQGEGAQMCDTSALQPNTPVAEAELKITNAGATWKDVELITP